jgi:hypothetical protein
MMENVEKILELVDRDCRRTIHKLADIIGVSYGVCQGILIENLNMRHIGPSSRQCARPHIPENHSLCLTATWLSFPILPTRQT